MKHVDVIIVGGGQAGLALSHCLGRLGLDHLVLERGQIGERWRSQSWHSLRLLTPNWLNELPGSPYQGDDADGFMAKSDFVECLESYARRWRMPVECGVEVLSCIRTGGIFHIATSAGGFTARAVVVATGHCDRPAVPFVRHGHAASLHASAYRCPENLGPGDVLVVGASSSGVQIADELARAGHQVVLAVGKHTRLPRRWLGRDIFWWLREMGFMTQRPADLADPDSARRQPSLQLAGRPDNANIDLASLQAAGVTLTGRVEANDGRVIRFADDLAASVTAAETKQARLLDQINLFAGHLSREPYPEPVKVKPVYPRQLSLEHGSIGTVIWASGYTRSFGWLEPSALRADGELAHRDGVTSVAGLYALGFRFLRKRDSNFIGGVGADAQAIAAEISLYLNCHGRKAA
ncbi:flavin-containing monooxygenase [Mesorhizobium sp. ArgA1]